MAEGQEGSVPPQAKQTNNLFDRMKSVFHGGNRQSPTEHPAMPTREAQPVMTSPTIIVDSSTLSSGSELSGQELVAVPSQEGGQGHKYNFVQEGALIYIVDEAGNKVSDGYHSYELFSATAANGTDIRGILAKVGSTKVALKPPTDESPRFQPSAESFHDIQYRADLGGVFVTKNGAMQQIVDNEGRSVTNGYHDIFMEGGKLYGTIGAITEEINPKKALTSSARLSLEAPREQ